MIGPLLHKRLISIYRGFLRNDFFDLVRPKDDPNAGNPASMRHLVQEMTNPASTYLPKATRLGPDWLAMTLADLLALPFTDEDGETYPFKIHVFRIFCLDVVNVALAKALTLPKPDNIMRVALLAESSACSLEDLKKCFRTGNTEFDVAEFFMKEMELLWGARTLRSFFYRERNNSGYFDWHPGLSLGLGQALPAAKYHSSAGAVTISVSLAPETEHLDVCAFEWHAELWGTADALVPDAVVSGTAYSFARNKAGRPRAGLHELFEAADTVSDNDALQAVAFSNQLDDSEDLICKGDIVFVSLWERRNGADKGVGKVCLQAALAHLRSRFNELKTVVVDVKPSPFAGFVGEVDPPAIEIEKQLAIDAVLCNLEHLQLDDVLRDGVRNIVIDPEDDPDEVLQSVREAIYGE